MDRFEGDAFHSSEYKNGHAYKGKRAVVVGSNTSAHDIAEDLWEAGAASVTMVQRSQRCAFSSFRSVHNDEFSATDRQPATHSRPQIVSLQQILGHRYMRHRFARAANQSAPFRLSVELYAQSEDSV